MPEYLAPGVYVEEIVLGPTPIEGVSTSTTALVGLARRGPVNKPVLVTNIGEYFLRYGDLLDEATYGEHRWLPYATQGFFAEGGQRAVIVRVAPLPPPDAEDPDPNDFALTARAVLPTRAGATRSTLGHPAVAGATELDLPLTEDLEAGTVLRVGDGDEAELVAVRGFNDQARLVQTSPALARDHAGAVTALGRLAAPPVPKLAARPANTREASELRVDNPSKLTTGFWVRVLDGPRTEFLHLGTVPSGTTARDVPVTPTVRHAHDAGQPDEVVVAAVEAPATETTALATPGVRAGDATIKVAQASPDFRKGAWVVLEGNAAGQEEAVRLHRDKEIPADATELELDALALPRFPHSAQKKVTVLPPIPSGAATTRLVAGIRLKPDAASLAQGTVVMLEDRDQNEDRTEFVELVSAPDTATFEVSVSPSLRFSHAADVDVRALRPLAATTQLTADAPLRAEQLAVARVDAFPPGDTDHVIELDGPLGEYVRVSGRSAASGAGNLTLRSPLRAPHGRDTPVRRLTGGIEVIAGPARPDPELYPEPGTWGNEIRITVEESSILQTKVRGRAGQGDPFVELAGVGGVETGTLLQLPGNRYARVTRVEGNRVVLDSGVPAELAEGDPVVTRELRLTFSYFGVDEVFDGLALDPGHSRYFVRVVNEDSRTVHVRDLRPAGGLQARGLPLPGVFFPAGGSDGLGGIGPSVFEGRDASNADQRTGLFALLNDSDVSIVTIPGEADETVQRALIAHCEQARYRFAVLDPEDKALLDDVLAQRALYDSKYAALYYPRVRIFDTLENRLVDAPPSGHIAGVYARTDSEVGVHKAPANAALRRVNDLQFTIAKGQQDVLNPRGINAIRAFPGRGIRVWGARTISSDALWRYVNVRRLFIFLERSIDEATQYAVFEPNDLPLWNRLKGSVVAFLTTVWRSGALQGATEAEAFFVKVGLGQSMIQADIDAGRVIMLIGVAPVKPAEFVIFRIGQKAGGSEVSE
jgi:uncharacterized protein